MTGPMDEWLLRGGSLDASSGVVLPGVHLAERIEALTRRAKAELQASCEHRRIQAIHTVGRVGLDGTWRCTGCGLEGSWAALTSLAITRAYQVKPEDLTATTAARQVEAPDEDRGPDVFGEESAR